MYFLIADIIFYSPSADNAPALPQIKESHRFISGFLSSIGFDTSSGLKACWGKMQFQQTLKESLSKSHLIIVMDSYKNYPNTAKDIICRGIGTDCQINENLLSSLENKTNLLRDVMPEELRHIAEIPQNAEVYENPSDIEPALLLRAGEQNIIMMSYRIDSVKSLFESSLYNVCCKISGKCSESISFNLATRDEKYINRTIENILFGKDKKVSVSLRAFMCYTSVTVTAAEASALEAKMSVADSVNLLKRAFDSIYFKTNTNAEEYALTVKIKNASKKAVIFSISKNPHFSLNTDKLIYTDHDRTAWVREADFSYNDLLNIGLKKLDIQSGEANFADIAAKAAQILCEKHSADYGICFINSAQPAFVCFMKDKAAIMKCNPAKIYQTFLKTVDNAVTGNDSWDEIFTPNSRPATVRTHAAAVPVTAPVEPTSTTQKEEENKVPAKKSKDKKSEPGKLPVISKIVIVIAGIVFSVCLAYICNYFLDSYLNQKENKDLLSLIGNMEVLEDYPNVTYPSEYDPQFASLYAINQDFKGILQIPNTGVNYAVVQSTNNDYYLRRNFYQEYNSHGSIFLDYNADIRTPCSNIVFYGHNMKDGQMFGELLKYEDLDFYKEHPVITFNSVYRSSKYKIISVFLADVSSAGLEEFNYVDPMTSPTPDQMQAFISEITSRSLINTTVDVQNTDKLITLSTCDYTFNDARFVIVARQVREGEDENVDTSGSSYNPNPVKPAALQ